MIINGKQFAVCKTKSDSIGVCDQCYFNFLPYLKCPEDKEGHYLCMIESRERGWDIYDGFFFLIKGE